MKNHLLRLLFCAGIALLAGSVRAGDREAGSKNAPTYLSLSPVIWVDRPGAVQQFTVDESQVGRMLNKGLMTLTSAPDIATAWNRLGITSRDIVGIKITAAGGTVMATRHPLVHAICDGLRAAGVPSERIIVWDKYQDKMAAAGYKLHPASDGRSIVAAIVPGNFYDPDVFYRSGIIGGLMWGDFKFMKAADDDDSSGAASRSYYTKFVTQVCTKLINVPVLTDDSACGISGCMSSLAFGSVDNNRRFQGPPSFGDPAVNEILFRDCLRKKVVVHILDGLIAQCAGGPAFNPQYCQPLGSLYISRDPVAVDSIVLPILERMRRGFGVTPIGNTANYIKDAPLYNLGTTDRRRIQLVHLQ